MTQYFIADINNLSFLTSCTCTWIKVRGMSKDLQVCQKWVFSFYLFHTHSICFEWKPAEQNYFLLQFCFLTLERMVKTTWTVSEESRYGLNLEILRQLDTLLTILCPTLLHHFSPYGFICVSSQISFFQLTLWKGGFSFGEWILPSPVEHCGSCRIEQEEGALY